MDIANGTPAERLRKAAAWAFDDERLLLASACRDGAEELTLLRALLAAYVADEDRFNAGNGEPYGSIPTETGILARTVLKRN